MPKKERLSPEAGRAKRIKAVKVLVASIASLYVLIPEELPIKGLSIIVDSATVRAILACIASELAK